MPNDPLHKNTGYYRGSAPVALLCEGDVIGYEAQLLGRWYRTQTAGGLRVDVWACGTGHGMRAMADAFGREVKIVGIEDRDFRSDQEAQQDSIDRFTELDQRRGVAVRGWFTWSRNEVENYFLDDDILIPVMKEWFGCKSEDVKSAVELSVKSLAVFQAVQASVYRIRRWWEASDPAAGQTGSPSLYVGGRPLWGENGLKAVDTKEVEARLVDAFDQWRARFAAAGTSKSPPPGREELLGIFRQWSTASPESGNGVANWRTDWAGKEILKIVRQQLAFRFGTQYGGELGSKLGKQGIKPGDAIPWHKLQRSDREAIDRELEHEMQPRLVKQLLRFAENNTQAAIRDDLGRIGTALQK